MYICIYISPHTLVSSCPGLISVASVWLGLTSREQLMSPEGSKHQGVSLAKILAVNKQKNILFSSVFFRVLNE